MDKKPQKKLMARVTFNCPADWIPEFPPILKRLAERHAAVELPVDLPDLLNTIERLHIDCALARTNGNRTQAAKLLGLQRTTLSEKILSNAQPRREKSRSRTTTGPIPPRPRDETNEEE